MTKNIEQSDEELVLAFQKGGQATFDSLVLKHQDAIFTSA